MFIFREYLVRIYLNTVFKVNFIEYSEFKFMLYGSFSNISL